MKQPSNAEKVAILERVLRAIFGRPEGKIEYRPYSFQSELWIECDIDDAVRLMGNLEMNEIEMVFYTEGVMEKLEPWLRTAYTKTYGKEKLVPEVRVMAELMLMPQYWKENEELKKQIKTLRREKESKKDE